MFSTLECRRVFVGIEKRIRRKDVLFFDAFCPSDRNNFKDGCTNRMNVSAKSSTASIDVLMESLWRTMLANVAKSHRFGTNGKNWCGLTDSSHRSFQTGVI